MGWLDSSRAPATIVVFPTVEQGVHTACDVSEMRRAALGGEGGLMRCEPHDGGRPCTPLHLHSLDDAKLSELGADLHLGHLLRQVEEAKGAAELLWHWYRCFGTGL